MRGCIDAPCEAGDDDVARDAQVLRQDLRHFLPRRRGIAGADDPNRARQVKILATGNREQWRCAGTVVEQRRIARLGAGDESAAKPLQPGDLVLCCSRGWNVDGMAGSPAERR